MINIYGEQESRSSKDGILKKWEKVLSEVAKIEAKEEYLIIIGDLNKHIGDIVKGNENDKVTFGGSLVRDFVSTGTYELVNASNKASGGPFTRYDPSDPNRENKKSLLDLCIISKGLSVYLLSLVIDKSRALTPCRPISKDKLTYTDHYSLILKFKDIPMKKNQVSSDKKTIRWNTNKEGGWENYKKMTSENVNLLDIINDDSENANNIMKKIDKEVEKIKYKAFGKVKEHSKPKSNKELEVLQKDKIKIYTCEKEPLDEDKVKDIDRKIAANLLQKQRETFETELKLLREMKSSRGRAAAIFHTKDKIVGNKAAVAEAVVLINPKTKEEVTTPMEIKKVSLDYCTDLLTNRKPKVKYEEDILMKELIHEIRMNEVVIDDIEELSEFRFNATYDTLVKKPGSKYKFIMNGGPFLKAALLKLCQVVWRTEVQPDRWAKSTLIQSYKGKGERGVLDNQRHLHITDE